jgi:hypothetical protein
MKTSRKALAVIAGSAIIAVVSVGLALAARGNGGARDARAPSAAPARKASPPAAAAPRPQPTERFRFSFKLDPRLTQSLYMGDRWVSPPVFQAAAQVGDHASVVVRAELVDVHGRIVSASPTWTSSSRDVVVSPARGRDVEITVRRPGASSATVTSGDVSRTLTVRATLQGRIWSVHISNPEPGGAARGEVASRNHL